MAYKSDSISTVIKRLNTQYFLPALQREFVWQPDQILSLFDSIMCGYPISSFLLWEVGDDNRRNLDIYKFVENFQQYKTHNEPTRTDGIQQLTLVLDGQQRLTSLLIGLRGTYTVKKKWKWAKSSDAWTTQILYLDLLKDPEAETEDDIEGRYGFRFWDASPANSITEYWFKVGEILNFADDKEFSKFKRTLSRSLEGDIADDKLEVLELNLERLYNSVWKDDAVSYYIEHDQNSDRVLDIFVRTNQGGTTLGKSDLLLSMITSTWDGINAREEIYGFVDRLNVELDRRNNFDKDFVMKTCLVLCDIGVQYKVENFSNHNLALIKKNWKRIKSAIESGVKLVNSFGIERDNLTSANALIPVIYYLYKRPHLTLRGSSRFDARNATSIRCWVTMALLNKVFGGQSDNVLRDVRRVLQDLPEGQADFPVEAINDTIGKLGKNPRFDNYAIGNYLSLTYGGQLTFLALTLLYDENGWGSMGYHQDHIFPRALFTSQRLAATGLDPEKRARYLGLVNRIGNLQLLLAEENLEKSGKSFDTWLTSRDDNYKQRHLIPEEDDLLRFDRFEEFIDRRETLIVKRLIELFPNQFIEEES